MATWQCQSVRGNIDIEGLESTKGGIITSTLKTELYYDTHDLNILQRDIQSNK